MYQSYFVTGNLMLVSIVVVACLSGSLTMFREYIIRKQRHLLFVGLAGFIQAMAFTSLFFAELFVGIGQKAQADLAIVYYMTGVPYYAMFLLLSVGEMYMKRGLRTLRILVPILFAPLPVIYLLIGQFGSSEVINGVTYPGSGMMEIVLAFAPLTLIMVALFIMSVTSFVRRRTQSDAVMIFGASCGLLITVIGGLVTQMKIAWLIPVATVNSLLMMMALFFVAYANRNPDPEIMKRPLVILKKSLILRLSLVSSLVVYAMMFIVTGFVISELGGQVSAVERLPVAVRIGEMMALISLAVLGSIYLGLRHILIPIQRLNHEAEKIRSGMHDVEPVPESADEVGQMARTFNQMAESIRVTTEALEEKVREQKDFINFVAHELKGPMTAIRWNLEMLDEETGEDGLGESFMEHLSQITEANIRTRDLVEQLLDFARLERGAISMRITDVSISEIVSIALSGQKAIQTEKGIEIRLDDIIDRLPSIASDRERMTQVVGNLLSNAIKYSPNNSTVSVSGDMSDISGPDKKVRGKYVKITVSDEGMGIPKDQQSGIFSRFFRTQNAIESKVEGTGLGLHICRRLMEMQNGEIWFDSEEGKGSRFHITVPVASSNDVSSDVADMQSDMVTDVSVNQTAPILSGPSSLTDPAASLA